MTQIVQRAASDWLSLRRPADEAARVATVDVLSLLNGHLTNRLGPRDSIDVVDLGAGTGANMAWLAGRLSVPQRWTLIDRDEDLLGLVPSNTNPARVMHIRRLAVELEHLQSDDGEGTAPDLVTCSAFLDVLTVQQVQDLCAFVVQSGAAALFSLTVDGTVNLHPAMEQDSVITAAFNSHQVRHGLAGPSATEVASDALGRAGCIVHLVRTPWILGPADAPLAKRYLSERIAAVIEQDTSLTEVAEQWLDTRMSQLLDGALTVKVGHLDLVALPPSV